MHEKKSHNYKFVNRQLSTYWRMNESKKNVFKENKVKDVNHTLRLIHPFLLMLLLVFVSMAELVHP
jgi:hypothetical protein